VGSVEGLAAVVGRAGATSRWVIDPSTGRVLRLQRKALGQAGPADETQELSDYRAVDGLMLPFGIKVLHDGRQQQVATLEACEVNPAVDPALFEKPQVAAQP